MSPLFGQDLVKNGKNTFNKMNLLLSTYSIVNRHILSHQNKHKYMYISLTR